jgi:hypothetical protein
VALVFSYHILVSSFKDNITAFEVSKVLMSSNTCWRIKRYIWKNSNLLTNI